MLETTFTWVQAARATSQNLDQAKLAACDIASSRNAHEASSKVWTLWQRVEKGTIVTSLARMLVSAYSRPLYALLSPITTHTMLHLVIPLYQLARATAMDLLSTVASTRIRS